MLGAARHAAGSSKGCPHVSTSLPVSDSGSPGLDTTGVHIWVALTPAKRVVP